MDRGSIRRPPAVAGLAAVVVVSAALRFWAATRVPTPWIAPDEMLYALLGRGLWSSGHLSVLGGATPFYSLVYPALAGLPLSLAGPHAGYEALKAVQAVVMSLAAVPVFLWGRTLMRERWALAAAVLTVAIPGLAYSGQVMTEVAFYPVFVLAAWAAAAAIARPTGRRQALLLGAVALAAATRLQALVLVAAVPTAVLLDAAGGIGGRARLRALRPVLAVGGAALAAFAIVRGSGLGGYAAAAGGYSAGTAAKYVLYHAAALLLACGVVPACAVALLALDAARRREAPPQVRAFLAVAVSFSAWVVVEVGVFASENALRIEERDLLGLLPLLFLGFCLWLDRGSPRRYVSAAAIALVAAAIVLVVPYGDFVNAAATPDSFTFAAAQSLLDGHPGLDASLLIGIPAAILAALVVLLPRRALPLLAAVLVVALAAGSVAASGEIRARSAEAQSKLVGADPSWIDRHARGPVAYLYGGSAYWNAVWANAFWNRRVDRVYDLGGDRVGGAMPQHPLLLGGDGVLRAGGGPIRQRYAVTTSNVELAGTVVAQEPLEQFDQAGLVLWKLGRPPRVLQVRNGFQPNGDVYADAWLRAYDCTTGSFVVTLLGKGDAQVELLLNGNVVRTVPMKANQVADEIVHAQPVGRVCTLALRTNAIVGTTVFKLLRG